MNAVRIRTRIDSITLTAPELGPLIGKQVEIIVLEEEPQISPLLVTRGMFAHGSAVAGDPVADTLFELRAERAHRAEMLMVAEKGRVPGWGPAEVQRFVQAASHSTNYRLSDLTPDLVMASSKLPAIPDIFDRLIAAEAVARDAILISRDQVFSTVSELHTVWA